MKTVEKMSESRGHQRILPLLFVGLFGTCSQHAETLDSAVLLISLNPALLCPTDLLSAMLKEVITNDKINQTFTVSECVHSSSVIKYSHVLVQLTQLLLT